MRYSALFFLFVLLNLSTDLRASLSIDTNDLDLRKVKKSPVKPVEPPYIPSSFLKTGVLKAEEPESVLRRLDVMFFVSTPIIFYLTINIIQQVEGNFNENWENPLDNPVHRNTVFMTTLMIPVMVAYKDYLYLSERRKIDALSDFSFFYSPFSEVQVSISLFSQRF